jgi:predicted house-cleaning noncanonical NTP pyrophosphatase (MazG superfamily)
MKFDKLVRDKIPAIIEKKGKRVASHIADEIEYWTKLTDKLQEEVDEFMADQKMEELSDILEVIYAICEHQGYKLSDLETARATKHKEKGGFVKKIILDEVTD